MKYNRKYTNQRDEMYLFKYKPIGIVSKSLKAMLEWSKPSMKAQNNKHILWPSINSLIWANKNLLKHIWTYKYQSTNLTERSMKHTIPMSKQLIGKRLEKHQESRIKVHVVHVGLSQLLEHSKSTPEFISIKSLTFQNNNWLIVQVLLETKDAMVDGWIQLMNMLKQMVLLPEVLILTLLGIKHARMLLLHSTELLDLLTWTVVRNFKMLSKNNLLLLQSMPVLGAITVKIYSMFSWWSLIKLPNKLKPWCRTCRC